MKKARIWTLTVVLLAALLLIFSVSILAGNQGKGKNKGPQTKVEVTIAQAGSLSFEVTGTVNLDVGPPAWKDTREVELNVDGSGTNLTGYTYSVSATAKPDLKIRGYGLIENGHLTIGGNTATKEGGGWNFGTVATGEISGDGSDTISVPVTVDISEDPTRVPAGSPHQTLKITWTVSPQFD